ncbi:hypothetical protein JCM24511_09135 [Saitozyma sp. JCM 24511]|nr:hypothetical protein JCM24511_09135 [Saitozyma sp. JCM 24511]
MTPPSGDGNAERQKKRTGPPPPDEKLARNKVEALLKGHPFPTIPQSAIAPIVAATSADAPASTFTAAPPALASTTSVGMVDTGANGDRDDDEDEDEGDDLDSEVGDEGEEENVLEESPSTDESTLLGELRRRRNLARSDILSSPIGQPTGFYVSPYTALKIKAESKGDGNEAFKLGRAEAVDVGLDRFLREVAIKATGSRINEAEHVLPEVMRLLGVHPAFLSVDKSSLSLVDEGAMTSFAPCIVKGSTVRADGRLVSHLCATMVYMVAFLARDSALAAQQKMRLEWKQAIARLKTL